MGRPLGQVWGIHGDQTWSRIQQTKMAGMARQIAAVAEITGSGQASKGTTIAATALRGLLGRTSGGSAAIAPIDPVDDDEEQADERRESDQSADELPIRQAVVCC